MKSKNLTLIIIIAVILVLGGCGCGSYNSMNGLKQDVARSWSDVENQYKRRGDLIDNLVNTVKGAANFEQSTLTQVTQARASASQVKVDPSNITPEQLGQFQAAQNQVGSALSRLLVTVEAYPELKSTALFQNLQVELSNTENKIATERSRFNEVARNYNTAVTKFPNVLYAGMLGFKERPYFEATAAEKATPKVDFSK